MTAYYGRTPTKNYTHTQKYESNGWTTRMRYELTTSLGSTTRLSAAYSSTLSLLLLSVGIIWYFCCSEAQEVGGCFSKWDGGLLFQSKTDTLPIDCRFSPLEMEGVWNKLQPRWNPVCSTYVLRRTFSTTALVRVSHTKAPTSCILPGFTIEQ